MATHVVIIGAGKLGKAMEAVLAERRGIKVALWDKEARKVPHQKGLNELIPTAQVILLCIPSWAVREFLVGARKLIKRSTVCVSFSKGIEAYSKRTAAGVMRKFLPRKSIAVVGGPMFAHDFITRKGGYGVCAAYKRATFNIIEKLFKGTQLALEYSKDVKGVALAGVLKNVYGIGMGMLDGVGVGDNRKGYYVAKAVSEMAEILRALGGRKETVLTSAGIGDFVATGYCEHSHHRKAGCALARGERDVSGEGIISLPSVIALLKKKHIRIPEFLDKIRQVAMGKRDPTKVFE